MANYLHPNISTGRTPRSARCWVNRWYDRLDKIEYEFIHTPCGPIMLYKDSGIYHIRNPKNMGWFTVSHGLEDFKQNLVWEYSSNMAH